MKLENLKIQNFLSIKELAFNLDNRGLVLVQGRNLDDINFDSNGAGKTSFIEAIAWVLFGKTVKGLKGDEVIHRQVKKNCAVSLSFTDDDNNEYTVNRYRKHKEFKNSVMLFNGENNITQKSDKDTTEYIEALFQMNYDIFTSTLLYSSHSFKFTSSSDAEMKKSLDILLNMEIWNKCLEETKNRKIISENEKSSLIEKINYNEKYITMFNKQLEELKIKEKENKNNWIKAKEKYILNIKKTQELLDNLEAPDESDLLKYDNEINQIKDKLDAIENEINEYDTLMENILELRTQLSESEGILKSISSNSEMLQKQAEKYLDKLQSKNKLIDNPCPVCGSLVTAESIENVTAEIKAELRDIYTEHKNKKAHRVSVENQISSIKEKIALLKEDYNKRKPLLTQKKELEQKLYKVNNNRNYFLNSINSYKQEKKQYEESIDMYKTYIKESENKMNQTFTDSIKNLEGTIKFYLKQQDDLNIKLKKTDKYLECLNNWILGFSNKGIKSLLLDNVTPFLNERTNYYLNKLTSGSIEIEFKTQAETKSGELRDKFTMNIINKNGGNNYNSSSDGEKRRIDISVNLALQDLLSHRSSKHINIAFFDECFDTLDGIGCERIIEVLQENINNKSSIFITSHNEQFKSFFDKSIILTKKNGFTTLKVEI